MRLNNGPRLNLGDTFRYAPAASRRETLLFTGKHVAGANVHEA